MRRDKFVGSSGLFVPNLSASDAQSDLAVSRVAWTKRFVVELRKMGSSCSSETKAVLQEGETAAFDGATA